MSGRTAEANKAIRQAWQREQELVKAGLGTRDWTPKQQQDILEKGRAYDNDGRSLEGQHMKSVEKYPEYQGNPDNIQFLTREEHFAAHKENWQNPTNWYYDPVNRTFDIFGEDELKPCPVIKLCYSYEEAAKENEPPKCDNAPKEADEKKTAAASSAPPLSPKPSTGTSKKETGSRPPAASKSTSQAQKKVAKTKSQTRKRTALEICLGMVKSFCGTIKTAVGWVGSHIDWNQAMETFTNHLDEVQEELREEHRERMLYGNDDSEEKRDAPTTSDILPSLLNNDDEPNANADLESTSEKQETEESKEQRKKGSPKSPGPRSEYWGNRWVNNSEGVRELQLRKTRATFVHPELMENNDDAANTGESDKAEDE